jgi:hypothetical protein
MSIRRFNDPFIKEHEDIMNDAEVGTVFERISFGYPYKMCQWEVRYMQDGIDCKTYIRFQNDSRMSH